MRLSLLPLLPLILPLFAPFPTALASAASRSLPAVPTPHALHLNAEQRPGRAARAFPPGAGNITAQVAAVEASFYRTLAAQAGPTAGGDSTSDERTRTTTGRKAETARRTPASATGAASFPSPAGDRARLTTLGETATRRASSTRSGTRTRSSVAADYPSSLAPSTTSSSSSSSSLPSSSASATPTAPQPQSVLTRPLPGRTLAVLPIGLAVLTSALSFLLLMTAYMTYERMLYAAQFRARRAEAARRGAQLRALGLAAGVGNGEGRRARGREWRV